MLSWSVAAKTDAGCQRPKNGDNFFVSHDEKLFVVADGMGGAVGGARASKITVEAMEKHWQNNPHLATDNDASKLWLLDAIAAANFSLFTAAEEDSTVWGMGSTILAALQLDNRYLHIANVGDSRAYLVRDGETILLTQDHYVNRRGKLVTRCLREENIETIDHRAIEMGADDWIILCTDGLSIVLGEQEISEILKESVDPQTACEKLVSKTRDAGAPDNVTVIAIKYSGTDGGDKPPLAPVPIKPHPVQDDREISLALPPPERET